MAPNVYLTRTVSQMLFEGYEDPLINMARSLPFLGNSVPGWDRFGWFYTVQISSTTWTLSLSLLLYLEKRLNHIRGHLQHGHRNKFDFRQTVQLEPLDANPLLRGQLCKSERFSRGILLTSWSRLDQFFLAGFVQDVNPEICRTQYRQEHTREQICHRRTHARQW